MHTSILDFINAYFIHKMHQIAHICTYVFKTFPTVTPSDPITGRDKLLPQTLVLDARPPCHIFRASAPAIDVIEGHQPKVHFTPFLH